MPIERQATVLIVDDDREFASVTSTLLEIEGFCTKVASSEEAALAACRNEAVDVVLMDWVLGNRSASALLREVVSNYPHLPVIVVTGQGSMESAAEALRQEAFDYIGKPFQSSELLAAIMRALDWRTRSHDDSAGTGPEHAPAPSIIGRSPGMIAVYRMIAKVAPTDSTVFIVGESGTGKELVARALHENSPRAEHPFVAVNCGALTDTLLESELFGHVRGAFTGAVMSHQGVFETAKGGTVFLDEITETSASFQVKLLRVLQEHEIRPVGAGEARQVDVRIVAATNRHLPSLLQSDGFRRDLLYRLSVINIELPPLRERREDIPLLVDHFLCQINSRLGRQVVAPRETVEWLSTQDWPGNVRELENAVERAVTLNIGGRLIREDFSSSPLDVRERSEATSKDGALSSKVHTGDRWICRLPARLDEVEREHILATLRFAKGNKLRASEMLGIARYSLYRKAKRLGIDLDNLPPCHPAGRSQGAE